MKKIVVIGAGVAGLATAALLAKDGYKVTVVEKNREIGGRGRVWKKDGYTFDMGPSWYMMPEVFESFLRIFDKRVDDYYQLVRLPIHYRVFFDGGRKYDISTDQNKNIKLFDENENGGGKKLEKYLARSKKIYETAMKELILLDYDRWNLRWIKLVTALKDVPLWGSFHDEVAKYFRNKDLQKILEFTTVFLGGSPYNTPALYTLMSHTDMGLGLWYPMGGMNKVFTMLYELGKEYGVDYRLGTEVKKIAVIGEKAVGVETDKGKIEAEAVVSGADYSFTETQLLDKKDQTYTEDYWKKATLSPAAVVMYLGLNKKIKALEHHNLYFSNDWEKGFAEVFGSKKWPNNPSYYVHVPSRSDRSVAPKNGETVMILVPVAPYLEDKEEIREKFGEMMIDHLEKISGESIKKAIVVKRIFSHQDFINEYHAQGGAAFGLAHTWGQSAFFRPKNRSKKVTNLYYAGQSTNPGVGVPIGILSAMICRNLINREK